MKTFTKILASIVFCTLFLSGYAVASNTDNHTVTVTVSAINELAIAGGNVTLTIHTATAGSNPDPEVDNTTADLAWTTNESSKKITIVTNLASQKFTLKALAQIVTGGTAASEVTVTDTPTNFVTGIATTTGGCDIRYTAQATAAQGTGSDVHTITFTLTAS
jgi:hypothetical protein